MVLMEPIFAMMSFTKSRRCLLAHEVVLRLVDQVVGHANALALQSDALITVDGTLIDVAASLIPSNDP